MEPPVTTTESWHTPLSRVTILSKVTAAIVFITPHVCGVLGGLQQLTA